MDDEQAPRAVAVDWSSAGGVPVQFVNTAVSTLGLPAEGVPDGITLVLGYVELPILIGDEATVAARRNEVTSALVNTVGKFVMSRERAVELIRVLEATVEQFDASRKEEGS